LITKKKKLSTNLLNINKILTNYIYKCIHHLYEFLILKTLQKIYIYFLYIKLKNLNKILTNNIYKCFHHQYEFLILKTLQKYIYIFYI